MISAIVLASEREIEEDTERTHEIVVRSLVWLVSAVVAGVVRDVTLAVPAGFGLSEVADQSGCELVVADDEAGRLEAAIAAARGPRLLVLQAGWHIDSRISEEIESFARRAPAEASALILATPRTAAQRLVPSRAPAIGVLVSRALVQPAPRSFARLVRAVRRGSTRFATRATRIS